VGWFAEWRRWHSTVEFQLIRAVTGASASMIQALRMAALGLVSSRFGLSERRDLDFALSERTHAASRRGSTRHKKVPAEGLVALASCGRHLVDAIWTSATERGRAPLIQAAQVFNA
jgi:hypothetical protein